MDTTTILIIIGIIILVAMLIGRSRTAPRGTYDDPNVRSGGSIGGGPGAYDDPDHRSSGSIGGAPSTGTRAPKQVGSDRPRHDDPDHRSGGSIGG